MDLSELSNNPEQVKQLILILQELLSKQGSSIAKVPTKPKAQKKPKAQTKAKDKPNTFINKFESMSERNLHKEDSKIDKLLNSRLPTERNRKFQPVKVVCRSCGKQESVNPTLIQDSVDRYKCNKCSLRAC